MKDKSKVLKTYGYVLALSDYKYIFKACCCRGLQTRPPIRNGDDYQTKRTF